MIDKIIRKVQDQKLSTKFLGALFIILIGMTFMDILYNAKKERDITNSALKEWTFLFAENVRISLNTLMREGRMDLRFAMFKSMSEELSGLKDIRVIRADRTNEIFREMIEKDELPKLEKTRIRYTGEIATLEKKLATVPADGREELEEEIEDFKSDLDEVRFSIEKAKERLKSLGETDEREQAKDALDHEVLNKGVPIYKLNHIDARVLIPYRAKKKGCTETSGCHKYAKEGDVLGAISIEFSTERINAQIRENNLKMIGFWGLRFIIFMGSIALLLSFIIIKEIKIMVDVFDRVSKGDFSVRAPIEKGDEIGKMAEGFNQMASSLEETKTELDKRLLEVFALYNIGKVMNTGIETEQMLLKLVEDISKSEKIDKIMIMLFDEETKELYVASCTGFDEENVTAERRVLGQGFYGAVAASGEGRVVRDVKDAEDLPGEDIFGSTTNSILAVPFFRKEEVMGLICAYKNEPGVFEPSDLELFNSMAEHLSVALQNATLFEETKLKAIQDSLTGLYNKGYFLESLAAELEKSERYNRALSIFMLDIDNFKHYNDTNGHPEGDEVLKELSLLLKETIRSIDIPCRYGGEEFVIILPETTKEGASIIAERLVTAVKEHYFPYEESQPLGFVSISVGLASFPKDSSDMTTLIKRMDEALYRAKHAGKNRLVVA